MQDQFQPLFTLFERFLNLFPFSNIEVGSCRPQRKVVLIPFNNLAPIQNPLPFTRFIMQTIFTFIKWRFAADMGLPGLTQA
jgi:hypothetical protein